MTQKNKDAPLEIRQNSKLDRWKQTWFACELWANLFLVANWQKGSQMPRHEIFRQFEMFLEGTAQHLILYKIEALHLRRSFLLLLVGQQISPKPGLKPVMTAAGLQAAPCGRPNFQACG